MYCEVKQSEKLLQEQSLPVQLSEVEAMEKKDLKKLEESIQALWGKARLVSDQLLQLKKENKELRNRVLSLEVEESRWKEELRRRERELEDIRSQLTLAQSNGSNLFSKEELEALKARLKELIGKINSRL